MTTSRKALHAYVSDQAHENWQTAAQEWGVSVSALLEAMAPVLDEIGLDEGPRSTVVAARAIDANRRRRRRPQLTDA